eukprot:gene8077-12538_t
MDEKEHQEKNKLSFKRFLRFGTIDGSLLLLSIMAGVSFDHLIAKRIGIKGYGPLMGAIGGNAISDTAAALPEGTYAAAGALTGSMLPGIPPVLAMFAKKPVNNKLKFITGATCASLVLLSFTLKIGDED